MHFRVDLGYPEDSGERARELCRAERADLRARRGQGRRAQIQVQKGLLVLARLGPPFFFVDGAVILVLVGRAELVDAKPGARDAVREQIRTRRLVRLRLLRLVRRRRRRGLLLVRFQWVGLIGLDSLHGLIAVCFLR